MRIGASLVLIAIGAILRFAIDTNHQDTHGFNVGTAGVILMVVGAIGLIITAVLMSTRRRTDVITQTPTGTRGTTYVEPANPLNGQY
jgi:membrane-bound ClpP family serine protease